MQAQKALTLLQMRERIRDTCKGINSPCRNTSLKFSSTQLGTANAQHSEICPGLGCVRGPEGDKT